MMKILLAGGIYLPPHLLASQPTMILTAKQKQVLRLLAQGMPNKQIARQLGIAAGTMKQHVHAIYERLGIASRTQALLKAQELGLV